MPTSVKRDSRSFNWLDLQKKMCAAMPHLLSVLESNDGFRELRIKKRDDGSFLGICKGVGSDGGPTVLFGSGYDAVLCLMALDASIQGDNWRYDKPWVNTKGAGGNKK